MAGPLPPALLRRLKERLRARADSEHEQALIRIAVCFAMYVYLLAIPHDPDQHEAIVFWVTVVFVVDLVVGTGIFLHILHRPAINPARRVLAIVLDTTAINATILVGGPSASALYPLLLWIILGHGFRYGRPYLWIAATLSLALFSLVVAVSPDWRAIPALALALVGSLAILPVYFAVLLRKLTKAIARAEEASQAKGHFLATMSHELRTPLNAIIGMSELLGTTRLDVEQRDMALTIKTAAGSLLGLVDQVLDLAKIEARRFTVELESFDLHDSLARVRQMLGHLAAGRGLYLRLRLHPDTPYCLRGGARPLHQVLVNLVGNAIKFTERGGVTIEVRPVPAVGNRIRLRFAIRDTGVGLSPEAQAKVFERFARSDDSMRRGIGGTGLGLSITRELVDLMGGTIGVDSIPGRGATFWFELPLEVDAVPQGAPPEALSGLVIVVGGRDPAAALADRVAAFGPTTRCVASAEAAAELLRRGHPKAALLVTTRSPPVDLSALGTLLTAAAEPVDLITVGLGREAADAPVLANLVADVDDARLRAVLRAALRRPASSATVDAMPETPQHRRSLRVLVAEDNRTNQKVIGKLLEQAGHRPTIVASGTEALEALEEPGFDIVLMDLNMPEMTGIEAVKLLRFTHAPERLPPIVALSADATLQTREECRSVGFSAYLTKPVETALLLRTLAELTGSGDDEAEMHGTAAADDDEPSPPVATVTPLPTAGSGRPALDRAKIASLAALDRGDGFLDRLIEDFVVDVRGILDELTRAAARGDAREMRDQAHALRSSAAHMGALRVFEILLGWRELDDHALLLRSTAELARLAREIAELEAALTAFHAEHKTAAPERRAR